MSPRAYLWLAGAVVIIASGATGWRLHARRGAPIVRETGDARISPEERALQRAAEQRPRDPAPWRDLGEWRLRQRQPFEAVWALDEALERGSPDARTRLSLAAALEAAGLYRPAIETLTGLLQPSPARRRASDQEARVRLARLYLRLGEAAPAIAALGGAGSSVAGSPAGSLELGRARQMAGDLPGAIDAYRRHLALTSGAPEATIRLARALLEAKQPAAARRALEADLPHVGHDPRFPFYLGLSYIQEGLPQQPERAMDYFKEALVVEPRDPLSHYYLGLLLARRGRRSEARAHFQQAIQAAPTYPDPQLQLSRALAKTGDPVRADENLGLYYFLKDDSYQAASAFRAMEKAAPTNVQAPRLVSLAYLRLGRRDWALAEVRAALRQHPKDVSLLERLAMLALLTRSQRLAKSACEEWLAVRPGAPRAHWLLGRAAQDGLDLQGAIREYEIAVAAEPANPEYLASLAAALTTAGVTADPRRAAALLQQAARLDSQSVSYRHDLGTVLQQLGDLEGARRQLLAALDRDPHDAPSYSGITQLCVRLRQPALGRFFAPLARAAQDRSREQLSLARRLSQNPTGPEAHYAMANFLLRTASFSGAQSHLERALELRPNYPEARAALVRVKRIIAVQ
jgi:tetratricopeptide (TPR) repeat protein